MSWFKTRCIKCQCELAIPEWRVPDPNNPRVICVSCDRKIPKFIQIAMCCGHPMFWDEKADHLSCVIAHCEGHMLNPDHPFIPPRTYYP